MGSGAPGPAGFGGLPGPGADSVRLGVHLPGSGGPPEVGGAAAARTQGEGEAQAAAIAAKGSAEAEAMQKKADAFDRYGDAAVLQMLVEVLPQVVAKAAEPLAAVDKMTIISTDGASQLTRTVTDNVAQGMELLSSATGVDLTSLLHGITQKKSAPETAPAPAASSTPVKITD